jgi:hypothetical protein
MPFSGERAVSIRSAVDPASLHDEAFAADPFPSRLEAREGILRLFRYRRPTPAGPVPPLRMHQYHLTVPYLRATLTQEGSS